MSSKAPALVSFTPLELRASLALAGVYGLRMLGLFLMLPVLALGIRDLPGGEDAGMAGLALGMYGLTQAMLQIPYGLASDRWGRRPIIMFGLLLFAGGSLLCALAPSGSECHSEHTFILNMFAPINCTFSSGSERAVRAASHAGNVAVNDISHAFASPRVFHATSAMTVDGRIASTARTMVCQ
ncbi:MFS transporter [bacterium]|nr:MFS transporter [bacterium]